MDIFRYRGLVIAVLVTFFLTSTLLGGFKSADDDSVARLRQSSGSSIPEDSKKPQHVVVIGAGYAGLASACELARLGYRVTVLEKNEFVGGRANRFVTAEGFTFDAGPSWYWMPEVFDRFFARFGRATSEFYSLTRLDPAYRIVTGRVEDSGFVDVPGTEEAFLKWAKTIDPQASEGIDMLWHEARDKYEKGIHDWIWKPMTNLVELLDVPLAKAALSFDMFGGLQEHLEKFVSNPTLLMVLKWPVIFLGASPRDAPALYSLMTYAGHALGTWYPSGGMTSPALAMAQMARDLGVEIKLKSPVTGLRFKNSRATHVCIGSEGTSSECTVVDGVVGAGDYHFIEQNLLPKALRRYDERYWERQVLSPSCLLFYLGVAEEIPGLLHHTFFFDSDLESHLEDTFVKHRHSKAPTFYVSSTSKTDPLGSVPPAGGENLFVLVPVSHRLNGTDTARFRAQVLDRILRRIEINLGLPQNSLDDAIVYSKSYGPTDFEAEFHAFRGNAFGHANVLSQSLVLKPSMDSLVGNMVFTGHLTNPGPGVPPSIVSGTVAADLLASKIQSHEQVTSAVLWSVFLWSALKILAALHVGLAAWVLSSQRRRSYMLCVKLLFENGRTYFAAATLMDMQRFLDTAAMYALFRIADDFVDNEDPSVEREANLEGFISDFWTCWEKGVGDYDKHPALPAIIESSKRHAYSRDLFERFFRSMRMDVGTVLCKSLDDTMDYMEGSAAVIGEFMLPVLMPTATCHDLNAAMPHARDLGLAFQLTNMIRDIDEDIDLQRQYIPADVCAEHDVNIKLRHANQPGFPAMMEAMFTHADQFYASADKGIAMLPAEVRDVIKVARVAYHRIHHKIRSREYDIFSGTRVRVPFKEKLGILLQVVPHGKLARILFAELHSRIIHTLCSAPVLLVSYGALLTHAVDVPGCSYLVFHQIFTLPAILIGFAYVYSAVVDRTPQQQAHVRNAAWWGLVLCGVATLYTCPWDNYLVAKGVWGYDAGRVSFSIGFVPIEEYVFFSLETILTTLMWLACFPNAQQLHVMAPSCGTSGSSFSGKANYTRTKTAVTALFVAMWAAGGFCVYYSDQTLYMGLILIWAVPVLLVQWWFGCHVLCAHARAVVTCIGASTIFLCVIDTWAIKRQIWIISPGFTLPQIFLGDLPVEEATFFLVTSAMCTFGLTLAMVVTKYQSVQHCSLFQALVAVYARGADRIGSQHTAGAPAQGPGKLHRDKLVAREIESDSLRSRAKMMSALLALSFMMSVVIASSKQSIGPFASVAALAASALFFVSQKIARGGYPAFWVPAWLVSTAGFAAALKSAPEVIITAVVLACLADLKLDPSLVERQSSGSIRKRIEWIVRSGVLLVAPVVYPGSLAQYLGGFIGLPHHLVYALSGLCVFCFWAWLVLAIAALVAFSVHQSRILLATTTLAGASVLICFPPAQSIPIFFFFQRCLPQVLVLVSAKRCESIRKRAVYGRTVPS